MQINANRYLNHHQPQQNQNRSPNQKLEHEWFMQRTRTFKCKCQNAKSEMQKLSTNANFASAKDPLWGQQSNQNKCTAQIQIPNCNKAKNKHTANNAACGFSHFRLTVANLIREFSKGAGARWKTGRGKRKGHKHF